MVDDVINPKRIRDKAPYRKSMSLTEEDLMRATELERLFNSRFTSEAPFNFSKTISKALELAIVQMLQPSQSSTGGQVQQALTGRPADPVALQARQEQKQELMNKSCTQKFTSPGKSKRFQKKKRGF